MASSLPVVSAAYLTTLHHVPSRLLEPCPQGHVRRVRRQGLLAPLSSTRWRGSWGSCLQRAEAIDGANGIGAVLRHARGGVLLRRPTLWAVRVRDTCPWTEPPVRRGRGRQHRSTSSAARLGMPTSEGKRSGCALRAVCARRSDWLCASSGQLRQDSFVRLLPAYPVSTASSRLCVTSRPRGRPSQCVGGSRGLPNSFGAPTQVCGSPLERYPLMGGTGAGSAVLCVVTPEPETVWVTSEPGTRRAAYRDRAFCTAFSFLVHKALRAHIISRAHARLAVSLASAANFYFHFTLATIE